MASTSGIDLTSDDYLGIGLEDGLLKVVWNLGWFTRTELTVPDRNLTDGQWHSLSVKRVRQQMEVLLDELPYVSQVHGTYHELNTENKVHILLKFFSMESKKGDYWLCRGWSSG